MNQKSYKISKERLDNVIYKYIDDKFPEDKIVVKPNIGGSAYTEILLKRDFANLLCFVYFTKEYFEKSGQYETSKKAPTLQIQDWKFLEDMNDIFSDYWKPIFEKWFNDNFKMEVKTFLYE